MNALVAYRLEQTRRARLRAQVDHSRQALTLARARYGDGVTDFLSVLDAEIFAALVVAAVACFLLEPCGLLLVTGHASGAGVVLDADVSSAVGIAARAGFLVEAGLGL